MKVSLIQMDSKDNVEENFSKAVNFMKLAVKDNPDIICLPELFLYCGHEDVKTAEDINSDKIKKFQEFAEDNQVNLILGSMAIKSKEQNKITNTSLIIDKKGKIIHRYDKIHMFDVEKEDFVLKESKSTIPGKSLGFFNLEGINMGIGICYDVRYPEYFRALVKKGAEIIFLPSGFLKKTGEIAWDILTKTRAIENQVYFCACNQTGKHRNHDRWGDTRIISFDGKIIKNIESGEGIISAELDLNSLKRFRKEFPVLKQITKF